MNMTVTDSDKKLLSFLAAFLIGVGFLLLVFRPLVQNMISQNREIDDLRSQKEELDASAAMFEEMSDSEMVTKEQMNQVLQRFYPMLKGYQAENMVTVLALNHELNVQNLSVVMPERQSDLKWYQYSQNAVEEETPEPEEETDEEFGIYTARVTCVLEGEKSKMLDLLNEVSTGYPAISILSAEWSDRQETVTLNTEMPPVENTDENEEGSEEEEAEEAAPVVVQTEVRTIEELTLTFEIFMCEQ